MSCPLLPCVGFAVYDFPSQTAGDLAFRLGDAIVVEERIDDNWSRGESFDGRTGIFPSSFVQCAAVPSHTAAEKVFVSVAEFSTGQQGDLNFPKGVFIVGQRQVDTSWWQGKLDDGQTGIFPLTFVKEVPLTYLAPPSTSPSAVVPDNAADGSESEPKSTSLGLTGVVIANLVPKLPEEVELHKGDTVIIDDFVDQLWCRGRVVGTGHSGIFPIRFVELGEDRRESEPNHGPCNLAKEVAFYGRAKYDFVGMNSNELSFSVGDVLKLIGHVDDEWTLAMLDGKTGLTPTSYIDIVSDCPTISMDRWPAGLSSKSCSDLYDSGYLSASPQVDDGHNRRTTGRSSSSSLYEVLYDFPSRVDGDLAASKGDTVTILNQVNLNWVKARNTGSGEDGLIPLAFLVPVKGRDSATEPEPSALFPGGQSDVFIRFRDHNKSSVTADSIEKEMSRNFSSFEHSFRSSLCGSASETQPGEGRDQAVRPFMAPLAPAALPLVSSVSQISTEEKDIAENSVSYRSRPPRPSVSPDRKYLLRKTSMQRLNVHDPEYQQQRRQHRSKIINEILLTERGFQKDLGIVVEAFRAEFSVNADLDIALGNLADVIKLSADFTSMVEPDKDNDDCRVGEVFCQLADRLNEVYSRYCQCQTESFALLDKYEAEPTKRAVLDRCLARIRAETTCLDLKSMINRPVTRIMKYPLYIEEILKFTDGDHCDRQSLLTALNRLTSVARSVNESKRRTDLVRKYRRENDVTLSQRLARLSLHSVRKKGTRMSVRLSSTLGLTHLAKDERFNENCRQFYANDKMGRSLLRDSQVFVEQVAKQLSQVGSLAASVETLTSAPGVVGCHDSSAARMSKSFCGVWNRILDGSVLKELKDDLKRHLSDPLQRLLHLSKGPSKLIQKRHDKLLDFEAAAVRLEKQVKSGESVKIAQAEEEMKRAQAEYQALHCQLLNDLPRFNESSSKILNLAFGALACAHQRFLKATKVNLRSAVPISDRPPTHLEATIVQRLNGCLRVFRNRLEELFHGGTFKAVASSLPIIRDADYFPPRVRMPSAISASSAQAPGFTRDVCWVHCDQHLLEQKYPSEKMYEVCTSHTAKVDTELSLKAGSVVAVLVKKDPMGELGRWCVDSGTKVGMVPREILRPFLVTSDSDRFSGSLISFDSSPESSEATRLTQDPLLRPAELQRSLSLTDSNAMRSGSQPVCDVMIPSRAPVPVSDRVQGASSDGSGSQTTQRPMQSRRMSSKFSDTLKPSRPAPPPPDHGSTGMDVNPAAADTNKTEFCLVDFDYSASGPNEITVHEQELVAVHSRHDLEGNADWWLVETEDGDVGYVPANYLSAYTYA